MEYHKQLIGYVAVLAIVYFLEHQRSLRLREKRMSEQELEVERLVTVKKAHYRDRDAVCCVLITTYGWIFPGNFQIVILRFWASIAHSQTA